MDKPIDAPYQTVKLPQVHAILNHTNGSEHTRNKTGCHALIPASLSALLSSYRVRHPWRFSVQGFPARTIVRRMNGMLACA